MGRPRILLAEDHPRVAEELRRLLAPEFDVVAVVGDGQALLRAVDAIQPDVIVSDVIMPGLDGIAATAALLKQHPGSRVVLITVHEDLEMVEQGFAAGALGYVLKLDAARDLVPAVYAVLRGDRYLSAATGPDGPRDRSGPAQETSESTIPDPHRSESSEGPEAKA